MGRHGDGTAEGARPAGRGRNDGTAGGVALPLIAAAVVCLLLTSGVWLFSGSRGGDKNKHREPIGLNVPSMAPPTEPTLSGIPTTALPSTTTVSASPTKSKPPTTSKAPTTAKPTTKAPTTSAPPPPPPPPPSASASDLGVQSGHGTLTITNNNQTAPMNSWALTVTLSGDQFFYYFTRSKGTGFSADTNGDGTVGSAASTRPLGPGESIEIEYYVTGRGGSTCVISGATCQFKR
ncbi:hypothetical protein [Yinghuangia seranimata]|uniref:hypothetical protein n=1 Tax=Yinghuangia seranimata TaxID=408067 RepID=UPI00248BDCE8|nr:hypothetical protein [Yinghuangia seranimata]MDI2132355.1 hypothetical protein [Yinghuangia seranimata]